LLETSGSLFGFSLNLDEERVRTQFEAVSATEDFDTFLTNHRTQAFIVIQDDAITYEKYFNGASRDSIVTSFSTAKSFTSALIGIAISEGHIRSVDYSITDYLPELAGTGGYYILWRGEETAGNDSRHRCWHVNG